MCSHKIRLCSCTLVNVTVQLMKIPCKTLFVQVKVLRWQGPEKLIDHLPGFVGEHLLNCQFTSRTSFSIRVYLVHSRANKSILKRKRSLPAQSFLKTLLLSSLMLLQPVFPKQGWARRTSASPLQQPGLVSLGWAQGPHANKCSSTQS